MRRQVGPLSAVTTVREDAFAISGPDGDIQPGSEQGFYVRDVRFLDRLEVRVGGRRPLHLTGGARGAFRAVFHAYLPPRGPDTPDPTVLLVRRRVVAGSLHEELEVHNYGTTPFREQLTVRVGTDFAYIFDVKHSRTLPAADPEPTPSGLRFRRAGGKEEVRVEADATAVADGELHFALDVPPGGQQRICVDVVVTDVYGTVGPLLRCDAFELPVDRPVLPADAPTLRCPDARLPRLVRRSIADLESLKIPDPLAPTDHFAAAGSPWFLTLFGRDSLWAALMALPYDPALAASTLRVLARRQGRRVDPDTEEAPGKILHEVRRGALVERGDLPPFYYGTIDATPLFVILAHEAWRWGVEDAELEPLLPHIEAALEWMRTYGDPDGDGFLEYVPPVGRGLANQGWKDSADGVRFRDGRIARAPIALCEVQGYAYAAALGGAALLEHFGRPGAEEWRRWARDLADRFRRRFWVADEDGPYPAFALDHEDQPVDGIASNMGHLLFTGIVDADEAGHIARRLAAPDMSSGYGLRTLSSRNGGYNPLSYHCGSVWPHDTAIAIWGLSRTGQHTAAAELLRGLLRAAPAFDYRMPELFAGISAEVSDTPVPYPASSRPQAWAAAGALLVVRALLGAEADLPAGRARLRPLRPLPVGWLEVRRLRFGPGEVDVRVDGDGDVDVEVRGVEVTVEVER